MEYIAIGTIVNTHGLKGNVTVKTDSDFKHDRYRVGNQLYIRTRKGRVPVVVERFSEKKTVDVLKFKTYDDINAVEPFKGCVLEVADDDRETLEEDAYYVSELLGCEVYEDELIGTVKTIRHYPQGELLVVQREGKKDLLIPFRNEFIRAVQKGRIDVTLPEGLQ